MRLCLQYHFDNTLKILRSLSFDFDKLAITLQPSRNEELCYSPILNEKIAYLSVFGVRNLRAVEGLFMFYSVPKLDLLLFYLMKRSASANKKHLTNKLSRLWLLA